MEKRGLSNLIATVLIVLLALAAVAIVWGFIRSPLEESGVSIGLGTKCLESEAKPLSCEYNSTLQETTVQVQHSRGQDVVDVVVTVELNDGTTNVTRTGNIELFATETVTVENPATGVFGVRAGATVVVGDEKGNTKVCEESLVTIDCIAVN